MKTSTGIVAVLLLALLALPLFASGQGESSKGKMATSLTVALIENTSDYQTMKPRIEEWAAANNVKVEVIGYPNSDFKNTLVTAWAAGSQNFDLIQQGPVVEFVDAGFIIPLDGSVNKDVKLTKSYLDNVYQSVYEISKYKEKPYILYYSTDANPLIYRTDMLKAAGFDRPPQTNEELVQYAQKLTKDTNGDGVTDVWGFSQWYSPQTNSNARQFRGFQYREGGDWWKDGDYRFNDQAGVRAMQFVYDLMHKYKVTPLAATGWYQNELFNALANGHVAMAQVGIWMYGAIQRDDKSPIQGKVMIADMPKGSVRRGVELGGNGFQIPALTTPEKQATAWQAALYACSQESQIKMQQSQLDWSPLKSIYDTASAIQGMEQAAKAYADNLQNAYALPKSPYSNEVELTVAKHMDRILHDAVGIKQGLDDAYKEIHQNLSW